MDSSPASSTDAEPDQQTRLQGKTRIFQDTIFLFIPILAFCLPFYSLIHYGLTLRGAGLNCHFLALGVLCLYLAYRERTCRVEARKAEQDS